MTPTDRLDGLINNAFLNGKTEVMTALRVIRDDIVKLEAENEQLTKENQTLRECRADWEASLPILP